jgi:hypothetical protein
MPLIGLAVDARSVNENCLLLPPFRRLLPPVGGGGVELNALVAEFAAELAAELAELIAELAAFFALFNHVSKELG